jgi:hypothetical protein
MGMNIGQLPPQVRKMDFFPLLMIFTLWRGERKGRIRFIGWGNGTG